MFYRLLLLAVLMFSHCALSDALSDIETDKALDSTTIPTTIPTTISTTIPTTIPTTTGSGVVAADPFTVVFGLLFIVALIFIIAWVLRRMGSVSMLSGQPMKIVAALSVGAREKVLLVDIAGQQVLLGVAPGRVSHLQSFDQPVITPVAAGSNEFATKIKQLLQTADNTAVKKL